MALTQSIILKRKSQSLSEVIRQRMMKEKEDFLNRRRNNNVAHDPLEGTSTMHPNKLQEPEQEEDDIIAEAGNFNGYNKTRIRVDKRHRI